ncbi:MAG: D-2-hydroxyacid dehydrogenase [Pirellulaceae bacterium]|jgi:phosphoglycerate dehydrogenase-like enzyme|nr:D-2-hydroxyacid dehydrogenase [Pirellulaceae bacterium]MDP7018401.1 D-2-hydroxyacid dehydrogenase [Pirellulaceae bacterium]
MDADRIKMVIHPPIDEERLAQLRAAAANVDIVNCATSEQAASEIVDARAFFGKLTPALLDVAQQLDWVQSPTASLEHYVFPELIEHQLTLTNMRGLFSDVIADQVFGYILCFARNLHIYVRQQLQRRWEPVGGETARVTFAAGPGVVTDIDLAHPHVGDMTLGVIGLGEIGSEIARRGLSFSMAVVAVDPFRDSLDGVRQVWTPAELDKLLAISDVVVVAAPHTPETERMIGAAQFAAMKSTAYFINIGRGAIVDLTALTDALQDGEIAAAGLDVYETEPLPADHPLWRLENAILTPHVAGYSPRIAERHLEVVRDNLVRFAAGHPLRNVANKSLWF